MTHQTMAGAESSREEDSGKITIVIPHSITIRKRNVWAVVSVIMILMTLSPLVAPYFASSQAPPVVVPSGGGGAGGPPGAQPNCANPCKIVIQNSVFGTGHTVIVARGTQVIWVNIDDTTHTSTSNTGIWDTGIIPVGASSKPVTFNTDGVFPYFCNVHPMSGVIEVVG